MSLYRTRTSPLSSRLAGVSILLLIFIAAAVHANTPISTLVSPNWLNAHLLDTDLLIIDTREATLYEQAHIPGAINIPVNETFAASSNTYRVAGLPQIKALFSRHGINHHDNIIVYDDGRFIDAARFFWVLEVYGHEHVSLMDGGIPQWLQAGLPIENEPRQRPATTYIPTISHQRLTTKMAMQIALSNSAVHIIDARTHEEYSGEKSIADRSGHIPGAVNIPWLVNMHEMSGLQKLLSDAELAEHYQAYQGQQVITYCNRGKQSALTYFTLRHLGYDVSVYDGAWLEWANDQSLPIE